MPDDMQQDQQRGGSGGSTPTPDPTVLTTEALQREIATLRQLLDQRISGLRDLLELRVDSAKAVREEEFRGIDKQMGTAEQQRIEQKADTRQAVDAALTAQKEAVAKTEASTVKQIEEIKLTIATSIEGLRREFGDLKDRLTTVEQQKVGAQEQKAGINTAAAMAISTAVGFVAVAGVIAAIIAN